MSKGLLISDNKLLSDMYVINLQTYVDLTVEVATSISAGLEYLKNNGADLSLVIIFSNIDGGDCGMAVSELMQVESIELPIVMIGDKSAVVDRAGVHEVPANFDLRPMLRTCAKLLGVTAKEMAEKVTGKYYSLPIKLFKTIGTSPCDIFHLATKPSVPEEYVKVVEAKCELKDKVESYANMGVAALFVRSEDRLRFTNVISDHVATQLEGLDLSDTALVATAVEEGHEYVAMKLSQDGEVNAELLKISKKCIETMIDVSRNSDQLKGLINAVLSNKSGHLYTHIVLASFVSKHILDKIDWGSNEHVEKLQFVFFFHDIHLAPLYHKHPELKYEEDLLFSSNLSHAEKEVVVDHALLASRTVREMRQAPMGSDILILQHHGMTSGQGIAIDYRDDISPLAKVIIVSEDFVNHILKYREEHGDMSTVVVDSILEKMRKKFPRRSYIKIIDTLKNISL